MISTQGYALYKKQGNYSAFLRFKMQAFDLSGRVNTSL